MKTAHALIVMVASILAGAAESDFSARRLITPTVDRDELAAVPFDRDVYAATRADFADVRVFGSDTQALPFIIEKQRKRVSEWTDIGLRATVRGLTPGEANQIEAILEPPESKTGVSPAWIEVVTPLRDFEKRVSVEVRQAGTWTTVVTDAVIFDYSRYMDVRGCRIPLPGLPPATLYRIRFSDVTDTTSSAFVEMTTRSGGGAPDEETLRRVLRRRDFRIDAVRFGYRVRRDLRYVPVTEEYPAHILSQTENEDEQTTEVTLDCGNVPITALKFHIDGSNFSRQVQVQVSRSDSEGIIRWRSIGTGRLRSLSFRDIREEQLTIRVAEARIESLRITIANGDSPPLSVRGVTAICPVYRAFFLARARESYTLAYGNRSLKAPRYDNDVLRRLHDAKAAEVRTFDLAPITGRTETPQPSVLVRMINNRLTLIAAIVAALLVLSWAMWRALKGIGGMGGPDAAG